MKQKLSDTNICSYCEREYERGFYGAGPVYCSHKCNRMGRAAHDKIRIRERYRKYIKKDKDCLICGRSILKVGLRRFANKFCSKKCMALNNKIKHSGQKTVVIRIPVKIEVEVMKTLKIPVKSLPKLMSQIS